MASQSKAYGTSGVMLFPSFHLPSSLPTWLPYIDPKTANLPLRYAWLPNSLQLILQHAETPHCLLCLVDGGFQSWGAYAFLSSLVSKMKDKLASFAFSYTSSMAFSRSRILITPTINSNNPKARKHTLSTVTADYIFLLQHVLNDILSLAHDLQYNVRHSVCQLDIAE